MSNFPENDSNCDEPKNDGRHDEKPVDPVSSSALDCFLDRVEEHLSPDRGVISSLPEKKSAKQEIASEMGVEEEYERGPDEEWEVYLAVWTRYRKLRKEGEIREDAGWTDPEKEFNRELDRHHREEESTFRDVDNEI